MAKRCPKCKSKLHQVGRVIKCKRCGYSKTEEESNFEKRLWRMLSRNERY